MTGRDSQGWLASLIGKPYCAGGQGPEDFDCWGLVRFIYARMFDTELQNFNHIDALDVKACANQFEIETGSPNWINIDEPEHGCVVAMSRSKVLHHAGIWLEIDGGLCFHALDGSAVIAESLYRLKTQHFSKILFFRYGSGISSQ